MKKFISSVFHYTNYRLSLHLYKKKHIYTYIFARCPQFNKLTFFFVFNFAIVKFPEKNYQRIYLYDIYYTRFYYVDANSRKSDNNDVAI